jgi:uncharacterized protein with HEPN domain
MDKNKLYLVNILDSLNKIESYLGSLSFAEFVSSGLHKDAISKQLEEIGENIKNISSALKNKYKEVKWEYFVENRNFLSHVYQMLNVHKLWGIIIKDLPTLKEKILKIVKDMEKEK